MKFSLRPEIPGDNELFRPLRELRSPLSMEKLKTLVFHPAAGGFSAWNYLWNVAGGMLAVASVAGVLYRFLGNEPLTKHVARSEASLGSEGMVTPSTPEQLYSNVSNETSHVPRDISKFPVSENLKDDVAENISYLEARSIPVENLGIKSTDTPIENPLLTSYLLPINSPSWYATASSGAVFSHLHMLGEATEIGLNNGWKSIGIAFTNANGSRDWHDVVEHHSSASPFLFGESDQTIALLLGANYSIGSVALKGELGPAYIISSSKFIDPLTEAFSPSSVNGRFGAAAEISAFYNISDFFQAGVTNISSYHTGQFTSGILISVNIRP